MNTLESKLLLMQNTRNAEFFKKLKAQEPVSFSLEDELIASVEVASSSIFNNESDGSLIEAVRQMQGLTDRDQVQVFVVPPGTRRPQVGNFMHRPTTSMLSQRLVGRIATLKREIQELELGIGKEELSKDEENREINSRERRLERFESELRRERRRLAQAPRRGWIVVQRNHV
jgi:hypothetical protein